MTEKSTDHRLAGAVEKFNRSKHQFDELRAEMDAFFNKDPEPHSSLGEFNADAWEWVERFQVREEPPLRFGVILGDCVHNLRSCLDHVIWQVTLLDGGTPNGKTQFPIASKSEAQFEGMANKCIPGLNAEHRALVKRAQPYNAQDPSAHPLSVLGALSNTDKHQVVNSTYSFIVGDTAERLERLVKSYRGDEPSPVHMFWLAKQGTRLEHGTPWFRIEFRRGEEPPREVKVGGHMSLGIAFGDTGLDASDFKVVAKYVKTILEAFAADFPETEFVDE